MELILQTVPSRHSLLHSWGPAGSRMGAKPGAPCCASESNGAYTDYIRPLNAVILYGFFFFYSCLLSCCTFVSLIILFLTSRCSVLDVNNSDVLTFS